MPADQAQHVYRTIASAGADVGLRHAGYHALNSLRLEKAYRSRGHDIGWQDTPLEAGLAFTVDWDTPFIGRDALLAQRVDGVRRRLVQLKFVDPDVVAYHDEPIFRDGVRVGTVTSASPGWTVGASVALGYVNADTRGTVVDREWIEAGAARSRWPRCATRSRCRGSRSTTRRPPGCAHDATGDRAVSDDLTG